MSYLSEPIQPKIEAFQKRMETELDFCRELFINSTIYILAAKYAYYTTSKCFIDDMAYDISERSWYIMGRALGVLREDETSPCVGWDEYHPYAKEAVELANKLMRGKK